MIPPTQKCKKYNTGVFITAPNRAPAETQRSGFGGKRTSDRESESCRLRRDEGFVVRSDDSEGFVVRSDDSWLSSARTTASIAFVWSAAKPLPCQMPRAGKALHPNSGRKPGPT